MADGLDDLDRFVEQFTEVRIPHRLVKDMYVAPAELLDVKAPLLYASERLGTQRRSGFSPSIALLDRISAVSDRKVVVNEKAAWLFICTKNILKEGIVEKRAEDGIVLVVNEREEVLGYGKITGAGVTNKLDRGDFLRRER